MLQVVKRLAALAAVAVTLCGCDVYDMKGMFVPTSDLVGVRFEQSVAKTGNKSVATIEASEEYMFYVCTDPHVDGSHRNMTTFNEKIQWLKLFDSTENKTILADKYLAREYVGNTIGKEHLITVIGVWDRFEDIDFD